MTRASDRSDARRRPAGNRLVRRARQLELIPSRSLPQPDPAPTGRATTAPVRKVLLIEDDPSVRDAIIASLEEIGAGDIAVADDGGTGLALIEELRPSVVLLDLMLPVADGFDVLAAIRRRPPEARPGRIVVISGMGDALSAAALLELGADRVLTKPFTLTQFEAAING